MGSTKTIRQTLGISQQQLADFLGLARSHITMYEGARRELPTAALLKLAQLEISLQHKVQQKQSGIHKIFAAKEISQLQQYAKTCRREAALAKKQLAQMQAEYQRCLQVLTTTAQLLAQIPAGKAGGKDRLWLELIQAKNMKKIKTCGMARQVKLMLKEQALQHAITTIEALKF